jgi:hypothetical protein
MLYAILRKLVGMQLFTLKLVERLAADKHRTLVFAQSLGMLDMLQRALKRYALRSVCYPRPCRL